MPTPFVRSNESTEQIPATYRAQEGDMATFRLSDLMLVSATAKGDEGNSFSVDPAMSGNGAKIAFRSNATNLVPQDTNRSSDLFVKDTVTGEVIRANTAANGAQANASVGVSKSLSDDGRKVAFITAATNLVPGDTNKVDDALVKDLKTGAIIRASAAADGTQANRETNDVSLSPDGGKAVLTSLATNLTPGDTNRVFDVFIKDLKTGAMDLVSASAKGVPGNAASFAAGDRAVSADGTKVLFSSAASNLVPGDTNGRNDIFIKDVITGAITLVSTAADGTRSNGHAFAGGISDDGTKVMFVSDATNLVPDDTNGKGDIFVKDLITGTVVRANTSADGAESRLGDAGPASMSRDGSTIAFQSPDSELVPDGFSGPFTVGAGIFLKHLPTGAITLLDKGGYLPQISGDGTKIAFETPADNLVPGDTNKTFDIFTVRSSLTIGEGLTGGSGKDHLRGGSGPDILDGRGGTDLLFGKDGDDVLKGGAGTDLLDGGKGDDTMNGERGDDYLTGGPGTDLLHGGTGRDTIWGGDGRDSLHGGAGKDRLYGGSGDDLLREDDSDGILNGGSGNDWLIGGFGKDRMSGGPGDDTFIFTDWSETQVGNLDVVTDFDLAGDDRIFIPTMTPFFTVLPEGMPFRGPGGDPTGDTDVEIRWERVGNDVLVQVDFQLDRKADMEVSLLGVRSLDGGDFIMEL
jgi:Ca2+-binding RTX toxin-like protein